MRKDVLGDKWKIKIEGVRAFERQGSVDNQTLKCPGISVAVQKTIRITRDFSYDDVDGD